MVVFGSSSANSSYPYCCGNNYSSFDPLSCCSYQTTGFSAPLSAQDPNSQISLQKSYQPQNKTYPSYWGCSPETNDFSFTFPFQLGTSGQSSSYDPRKDGVVLNPAENELCKVCSSFASGVHFGVLTCEGCKGFFKRNHRNEDWRRLKCAKEGSCGVSENTRNMCRFCRFHKCLQVGMSRDAIKLGRRSKMDKQKLFSSSSSSSSYSSSFNRSYQQQRDNQIAHFQSNHMQSIQQTNNFNIYNIQPTHNNVFFNYNQPTFDHVPSYMNSCNFTTPNKNVQPAAEKEISSTNNGFMNFLSTALY
ncbi:nuclear receptor subfamily 1 group D member 2-like [Symsagittifera roscoffensis]|uniref:nuclear receptor subfamily 1 group D member 2-like n=1 Tax=Symsagittifera roscoffensis TaxID=84072 RepID=UPI00307C0317